jgi:hypothetical protein
MRPSPVGPRLENAARLPPALTAPTASTLSPSAGELSVRAAGPSLPAEFTTTMPRRTASSAAIVAGAMSPFRSSADQQKLVPV